jgi:hypothetical protein
MIRESLFREQTIIWVHRKIVPSLSRHRWLLPGSFFLRLVIGGSAAIDYVFGLTEGRAGRGICHPVLAADCHGVDVDIQLDDHFDRHDGAAKQK